MTPERRSAGGRERTSRSPWPGCCVCRGASPRPFAEIGDRHYRRCDSCGATILDPRQRPTPEAERAYYLLHENDAADPAYRRFLSKLCEPLQERLPPRSLVLDYGCGPDSGIAAMLREAGHEVVLYDPFFAPGRDALERRYDGIVCSEVAEHFHAPAGEFDRLAALLRPGGLLGVMTCFQTEDARFAGWHYRKDPTHVVFYREETLRLLAAQRGLTCEVPHKDVALLRRPRR